MEWSGVSGERGGLKVKVEWKVLVGLRVGVKSAKCGVRVA